MPNSDTELAERLSALRRARNWPLELLAEKTGVSRASLSRIERGDTSPTAAILGKLAAAFGVTVAELFGVLPGPSETCFPRGDQPVWRDAETGFVRRSLTPASGGYRGSMIEGWLPAGAIVSYDAPPFPELEHHLVLLEGNLRCTLGRDIHDLTPGDALRFRLNSPNSYQATGTAPARYILTVIIP
ncbi:helix-turn-helix domain-containing protein [Rhodobacterales bacterium]|nr:helix-turn-helix domain-containing protein [Rhodobacterales bacterium]